MDRAALVTAGSSGIGLAIARMLRDEGFGLTLASRRAEKVEAAAEDLPAKHFDVQAAVIALTRSLNEELDGDGVRAIAICPASSTRRWRSGPGSRTTR